LEQLRRFLGGQKATLVWDGLPAHRSKLTWSWLRRQRSWLVVEPLPAYAPELNPVEPLWSRLKQVELANPAAATLEDVTTAAERGIKRIPGPARTWPSRFCTTAACPCAESAAKADQRRQVRFGA
jgi:transposase